MMRLTDDKLFAYLDEGESDPFVKEMLSRDEEAQKRLVLLRRVREQLASVPRLTVGKKRYVEKFERLAPDRPTRSIPTASREGGPISDQEYRIADPLTAFLTGQAEREYLGEIRFPVASGTVGEVPLVLAELRKGNCLVEASLLPAGAGSVIWVRVSNRAAKPIVGARANLLCPGKAVLRFETDDEGALEFPVPEESALLRLELNPTCEIRLIPQPAM